MKAKTHLSQNKSRGGFTLVEMLVVIGMIATLAGISFPVYKSIQKKVEKQKFEMLMNSIVMAVDNFESEYNYLPYATANYPDGASFAGEGVWHYTYPQFGGYTEDVLGILMGFGNAANTCNFKNIAFLDGVTEAKGSGPHGTPGPAGYVNGIVIDESAGTATLYGPTGIQVVFRVDYDRDGTIENPFDTSIQISGRSILYYTPEGNAWGAPWITNFPY